MVIQTDTALAVHEYIYNTDERHALLSCLLLKLAISFLRIKVKYASQRYVFYNTRHPFVGFFLLHLL